MTKARNTLGNGKLANRRRGNVLRYGIINIAKSYGDDTTNKRVSRLCKDAKEKNPLNQEPRRFAAPRGPSQIQIP
jgi:hypothetical protein